VERKVHHCHGDEHVTDIKKPPKVGAEVFSLQRCNNKKQFVCKTCRTEEEEQDVRPLRYVLKQNKKRTYENHHQGHHVAPERYE
jgi:hypothetical protein